MEVAHSPTPQRLLYVITKSNWGGAQRYVYDLATAAKASGYDVAVALGGDGELARRLTDAGVPVHRIGGLSRDVRAANEWRAFRELLALMRRMRPDTVHLNSSKAGIAALAARLAGVRNIVFTVHGWAWNEDRPFFQKLAITAAYWVTLFLCHRVIAVSEEARRQARRLPFVHAKCRVIHNGIREGTFLSRTEARTKLLPESSRSFWIGTIAELHPVKGLDKLLIAFEHVAPDFPDSELVIIGGGEERAKLERLATIEGIGGRAHLVGHVENAAACLSAFDMFVLPSRSEGLAYVLLEAGLASLPVVASSVGGIPEVIEDGTTGLLVPYGDVPGLVDAFLSLARDAELRRTLGTALHAKVQSEFSLDQMIRDTFSLY